MSDKKDEQEICHPCEEGDDANKEGFNLCTKLKSKERCQYNCRQCRGVTHVQRIRDGRFGPIFYECEGCKERSGPSKACFHCGTLVSKIAAETLSAKEYAKIENERLKKELNKKKRKKDKLEKARRKRENKNQLFYDYTEDMKKIKQEEEEDKKKEAKKRKLQQEDEAE